MWLSLWQVVKPAFCSVTVFWDSARTAWILVSPRGLVWGPSWLSHVDPWAGLWGLRSCCQELFSGNLSALLKVSSAWNIWLVKENRFLGSRWNPLGKVRPACTLGALYSCYLGFVLHGLYVIWVQSGPLAVSAGRRYDARTCLWVLIWSNGIMDPSYVYMLPFCLEYGFVLSCYQRLFCFDSWWEPTGLNFSRLVHVQLWSNH